MITKSGLLFKFYAPVTKVGVETVKGSEKFFMEGYAATSDLDRQGEVIALSALQQGAKDLLINHTVFYEHKSDEHPIGKIVKTDVVEGDGDESDKLYVKVYISETADKIRTLIKEGILDKFSIGGKVLRAETEFDENSQMEVLKIYSMELYEVSVVGLPANVKAQSIGYEIHKSFKDSKICKVVDGIPLCKNKEDTEVDEITKSVVPYKPETKGSGKESWDASAAEGRIRKWAGGPDKEKINWSKYQRGFAWFDSKNKENIGGYKLLHHDIVNGKITTIWRGVAAAMAVVMGARGGVDVPAADKKGIYNHLAKHYKQFGKEVPEMKSYTEDELNEIFKELNATEEVTEMAEEKKEVKKTGELSEAQKKDLELYEKEDKSAAEAQEKEKNEKPEEPKEEKKEEKVEKTEKKEDKAEETETPKEEGKEEVEKKEEPENKEEKVEEPKAEEAPEKTETEKKEEVVEKQEVDTPVKCPGCGKEVVPVDGKCPECGEEIKSAEDYEYYDIADILEALKGLKSLMTEVLSVVKTKKEEKSEETPKKEDIEDTVEKAIEKKLGNVRVVPTRKGLIIKDTKEEKVKDKKNEGTPLEVLSDEKSFNNLGKKEQKETIRKGLLQILKNTKALNDTDDDE
ncbi:MAG: HK97 family phage prohead protease [Candidatus Hodarchaeota archaeon]